MPTPNPLDTPSRIEAFASKYLTHVKGELAGQPLDLSPWQARILRRIFNDVDDSGRRKVRTFYLSVPRKSGKSTLAAAIALYMLLSDDEPGAEIYSAAVAAKQARIVFDIAKQMVRNNATLRKRVTIHKDSLTYQDKSYKPFSNDPDSSHGLNPSCLVIDELHVFQSQRDREYYEALTSAQGARREPLTVILTTAGYDSLSLCGEVDQYAQKVESGVITDPTFASFIARATEEDDWQNPATWHKANPNLGVSVYEDYYREKVARAKDSPINLLEFQRYQLNQWVENVSQYIHLSDWDACSTAVNADALAGCECYGGLDLSNTTDLSAFVLTFPPRVDGEPYQVLPFAWLPADNMRERVRKDMVSYDIWAKQGFLELTPGNVIDHAYIIRRIIELSKRYKIKEINFDRWGSTQVSTALDQAGLEMIQFGQGFQSMSAPTKQLLTLILGKKLAHGGHPVLRWCIDNLTVEMDAAENVKPSKKLARERIDLCVALIMTLGSATASRPKRKGLAELLALQDRVRASIDEDRAHTGAA